VYIKERDNMSIELYFYLKVSLKIRLFLCLSFQFNYQLRRFD
jgi:hypothetical protein